MPTSIHVFKFTKKRRDIMSLEDKLLFINAPAPGQLYKGHPMSLLYAISVLHENILRGGIEKLAERDILLDTSNNFRDEESYKKHIEVLLKNHKPRAVGFGNTTYSRSFAEAVVDVIRNKSPESLIIFGGPHEDSIFEECRSNQDKLKEHFKDGIDIIVTGDAEYILDHLITLIFEGAIRKGSVTEDILTNEASIRQRKGNYSVWVRRDDEIIEFPSKLRSAYARKKIQKYSLRLSELPFAPRSLLPEKESFHIKIFQENGIPLKTAQVKTYRGCYFAINPKNVAAFQVE